VAVGTVSRQVECTFSQLLRRRVAVYGAVVDPGLFHPHHSGSLTTTYSPVRPVTALDQLPDVEAWSGFMRKLINFISAKLVIHRG